MNRQFFEAILLAVLLGTGFSVQAADPIAFVRQLEGKVFINQGEKIVEARANAPLYPGNRVITLGDSRAAVVYTDQCVIRLDENNLLTLKEARECSQGLAQMRDVEPHEGQQIAQGSAAGAETNTAGTADTASTTGTADTASTTGTADTASTTGTTGTMGTIGSSGAVSSMGTIAGVTAAVVGVVTVVANTRDKGNENQVSPENP